MAATRVGLTTGSDGDDPADPGASEGRAHESRGLAPVTTPRCQLELDIVAPVTGEVKIIRRGAAERAVTAVLSFHGYESMERRFSTPASHDRTRSPSPPGRRRRIPCERCHDPRNGDVVFCMGCGRAIGRGCTSSSCLLAEFPAKPYSLIALGFGIGMCVDCIPVIRTYGAEGRYVPMHAIEARRSARSV